MKRRKRHWVALGLAVAAAVPAMAQAKLTPYQSQDQVRQPMELGLSEGKIQALGLLEQTVSPEDLSVSRATPVQVRQPMELGLSEGKIRALGLEQTVSPEDLSVSRATPVTQARQPMELGLSEGKIRALGLAEQSATKSSDGRSYSIDVNAYTVTGFGVALFLAMVGFGIVWHHRGTKLSPA